MNNYNELSNTGKLCLKSSNHVHQEAVCRRFFSDPKCMTLNDLERLFCIKFCFCAGLEGSDRVTLEK